MGSIRFNKQRGAWFVDYIAANGERMRQTIGPGEDGKRLAKKVHRHLVENPAARVRPPMRPDREDDMRILQPKEITALLSASNDPWRSLYLLAIYTGLRRGELLGLRWRDVDLGRNLLHVRRSLNRIRSGERYTVVEAPLKTRSSRRTVDLSPTAADALLALPAGDDSDRDYVFRSGVGTPLEPDNIDRAFKRHLTLAGLTQIRFHDLRHTHASLLIAAGVHPKAIQARLGHSSITVTMDRYGHLMPSAFQGVGERLDALLQGNIKATNETRVSAESMKPAS